MRRDDEVLSPHVDLLEGVDAGDDDEDAGPSEGAGETPAQPVHHRPLALLASMATIGVVFRVLLLESAYYTSTFTLCERIY